MDKEYISREEAIAFAKHAYNKGLNVLEYIEEVPAADVVERPEWITAEHLQEIFLADREGRLRIAARPIEGTCGLCKWFERETGKASGKCNRRTKRYRSGLDSCAPLYVTQSRKACRGDYEKRSDGGQDDV